MKISVRKCQKTLPIHYVQRTMWHNRIKRKYIYISKQNSEIVSGSVNSQNVLIYFFLPDTFLFRLVHEVSPNMLVFKTYVFPNIQGFLKYEYNIRTKWDLGGSSPRPQKKNEILECQGGHLRQFHSQILAYSLFFKMLLFTIHYITLLFIKNLHLFIIL